MQTLVKRLIIYEVNISNLTYKGHPRSKVELAIYDFLYVFIINFDHNMVGL